MTLKSAPGQWLERVEVKGLSIHSEHKVVLDDEAYKHHNI